MATFADALGNAWARPGLAEMMMNLSAGLAAAGESGPYGSSRMARAAPYLTAAAAAPRQAQQQQLAYMLANQQAQMQQAQMQRQQSQDAGRTDLANMLVAPDMMPMSEMEGGGANPYAQIPQAQRAALAAGLRSGMENPAAFAAALMPKAAEEYTLQPGQTRYRGNVPIASVPAAPEKPSDIAQRAVEAGLIPGTPAYQKFIQDATLKPNATVNMPPLETAYDRSMGDFYATEYQTLVKGERDAVRANAQFDVLREALDKAFSGPTAEAALAAGRVAKQFGINVEGVKESEVASALSNELALQARNPAGGAGMPGSMSEGDREFLKNMTPNLTQTKEGRELLLEVRKRQNQRSIEVGKLAREYAGKNGGRLDQGFYDKLSEFSEKNPLFDGLEKKLPATAPGQQPNPGITIRRLP